MKREKFKVREDSLLQIVPETIRLPLKSDFQEGRRPKKP